MDSSPSYGEPSPASHRAHRELAALNERFLELLRRLASVPAPTTPEGRTPPGILGLDLSLAARVAALPDRQRKLLAACPYALMGVGLGDIAFWREVASHEAPGRYRQVDASARYATQHAIALHDTLFMSLAYAWHLAQTEPPYARWMLGASAESLSLLAALPFGAVGRVAEQCPGLLTARLADHRRFWQDLVSAAESGVRQSRFAAVSLGLQLSAAASAARVSNDLEGRK